MGKKNKEEEEHNFVSVNGQIYFKPTGARDLKGGKKQIKTYCKVYLDNNKMFKTPVIKANDPAWNETPRLLALNQEQDVEKVRFAVWSSGSINNKYIGELEFQIADLIDGIPRENWYTLKSKKGDKDRGELHLQVLFLKQGESITPEGYEFEYPLQTLLRKNNLDSWEAMINKEDIELDIDLKDYKGMTAISVAAKLNLVDQMQTLVLEGADLEIADEKGQTPLHKAAKGSLESLNFLIEKKVKLNVKDKNERTPLHIAALKNKGEIIKALATKKKLKINQKDNSGNTALHLAIENHCSDAVAALVEAGADYFVENNKKETCWGLAVSRGDMDDESEETMYHFFESCKVVDEREYPLKTNYKHRFEFGKKKLFTDWQENPQYCISGPKGTEVSAIIHYNDPIGKSKNHMEKLGLMVFRKAEGNHAAVSYIHGIELPMYAKNEPLEFEIAEDDATYMFLPHPKVNSTLNGEWKIVIYSNDENIVIKDLPKWKHSTTLKGTWSGPSAGGCIEHDTWVNNPKYLLTIPKGKETNVCILLSQTKNAVDKVDYQIKTYKYYIGFYIWDDQLADLITRSQKFKNSRELCEYSTFDGTETNLVIVPTTYKPNEETSFEISIFSDEALSFEKI